MHHFDISCPCVCHSVGHDDITGDAPNHLATVVLDHAAMTDFCGIPLISLRENCITELNLECKGVGVPGAIVLSKLLPSATAITSLKYACHANVFAFLSAPIDTHRMYLPFGSVDGDALPIDELTGTKPTEKIDLSHKYLGVASAIIIASCIKTNGVLKELKCAAAL